jgi:hypothetical protein
MFSCYHDGMTENVQPITVRLPRPLHEQLRRVAFDARESMNDIALAGITAEIARRQHEKEKP